MGVDPEVEVGLVASEGPVGWAVGSSSVHPAAPITITVAAMTTASARLGWGCQPREGKRALRGEIIERTLYRVCPREGMGGVAMRRVTAATGVVLSVALILAATGASGASKPKASVVGRWSKPFAELKVFAKRPPKNVKESKKLPPAVSMAMLPDGRIVYWGGLEGIEDGTNPVAADGGRSLISSRVRVLDIRHGRAKWARSRPGSGPAHDMFCADQRLLPNGKLLVVGGTIWRADPLDAGPDVGGTVELFGSNAVRLFNPRGNRWAKGREFMKHYRWYPTMVTMGSGDLLISSGVSRLIYNYSGQNVNQTEVYDPATGLLKTNPDRGSTSLPLFPRMHLLPNGNVFYGGVGQMWGPFGQAVDEALWAIHKAYNPKKKSWTTYGMGPYGARSGAFSVLMPLKPPYKRARILVGGGTLGSSPGSYIANNLTEIITVKKNSASSTEGPSLTTPRWYSSGVLLPDGNVVALSGADRDEVILPGSESPVRQAEIYDGKSWKPLASAKRIRTYHNTAMLLPNGSILVGGHAPINNGYGPKADNSTEPVTGTNNMKDPSFEIFRPPYLFRGQRPTISYAPRAVRWNKSFSISVPNARKIDKVVLSRLPSVTHITDADQRSVELRFRATDGNSLRAAVPGNHSVVPGGFYYLWVLRDNGKGLTPSKARIVRVGARSHGGNAPAPMGR
jgi:Domain of unknown function (DUF1929)